MTRILRHCKLRSVSWGQARYLSCTGTLSREWSMWRSGVSGSWQRHEPKSYMSWGDFERENC